MHPLFVALFTETDPDDLLAGDPRPSHATSPPPTQPPGVGVHDRLRDAMGYEVAVADRPVT